MQLVKKTDNHLIYKKRSGRFAVMTRKKSYVNGEEKAKILLGAGLVKAAPKKAAPPPAAAEEAPAEGEAASDA